MRNKTLLSLFLCVLYTVCHGQNSYTLQSISAIEGNIDVYIAANPTPHHCITFFDTSRTVILTDTLQFNPLNPVFLNRTPASLINIDANGYVGTNLPSAIPITSGQVTTGLGYTPTTNTRTITINGVSQDLSANRSWSISPGSGKRQETYSGTTNASGIYTVTYATAYSVTPNIQYNLGVGGGNKETILLTSSSTTGFTVYVQLRSDVLGLLPSYSNVNGRAVDILVTEK